MKDKGPSIWLVLPLVFVAIAIVWIIVSGIFYYLTGSKFDESFNGTNSLFSALALGGVITAIVLQNRELVLQRRELEDTREVLKKQQEQLEAHTQAFQKQNFESTFFSLINLHHSIVNSLTVWSFDEERHGRDCFELFYKNLQQHYSEANHHRHVYPSLHSSEENEETFLESVYMKFYLRRQSAVGHYFRNLYNIVRFVKDSQIEDKFFYIRLVRSQLSVFELSILFYNCLSSPGKGFKHLVEDCHLLNTIDDKDLLNPSHRTYYNPKAFE